MFSLVNFQLWPYQTIYISFNSVLDTYITLFHAKQGSQIFLKGGNAQAPHIQNATSKSISTEGSTGLGIWVSWPDRTWQDRTPKFAGSELKLLIFKKVNLLKRFRKKKFYSGVREGKRPVSGQSRFWKFSGFPDWMWCPVEPYFNLLHLLKFFMTYSYNFSGCNTQICHFVLRWPWTVQCKDSTTHLLCVHDCFCNYVSYWCR